jgi:predicted DNA-binding protein (MmcQ/YjbR family)
MTRSAGRTPDSAVAIRRHCMAKPGVALDHPWGEDVFKVGGKAFVFTRLDNQPLRVTVKCDPARVPMLRAVYPGAITPPGYLDKSRWNAVAVDEVPLDEVLGFIDESYAEVVKGLPKRLRVELGAG